MAPIQAQAPPRWPLQFKEVRRTRRWTSPTTRLLALEEVLVRRARTTSSELQQVSSQRHYSRCKASFYFDWNTLSHSSCNYSVSFFQIRFPTTTQDLIEAWPRHKYLPAAIQIFQNKCLYLWLQERVQVKSHSAIYCGQHFGCFQEAPKDRFPGQEG